MAPVTIDAMTSPALPPDFDFRLVPYPDHPVWRRLLGGLELRYVLTDRICSPDRAEWTVAALVDFLGDSGFLLSGRPSKRVSDALRWEVGRGRVHRVGRGRYRAGSMPGSTRRRIRTRSRQLRTDAERAAWEAATVTVSETERSA